MSTTLEELAKQVEQLMKWMEEEKYLPKKDVEGQLRAKVQELQEENNKLKEEREKRYNTLCEENAKLRKLMMHTENIMRFHFSEAFEEYKELQRFIIPGSREQQVFGQTFYSIDSNKAADHCTSLTGDRTEKSYIIGHRYNLLWSLAREFLAASLVLQEGWVLFAEELRRFRCL